MRLGKPTSNLFRQRTDSTAGRLNVSDFNNVIEVNSAQQWVEVEGMTPYAALTEATLAANAMPAVVPQLKSITIGGAVSGVGIESSSFRYGLPHETVIEMDVLTGDGRVLTCTPRNEFSDLFFGLPNSYGTLGYALRLKVKTIPADKFVMLEHQRIDDPLNYFEAIGERCDSNVDFVDGSVFGTDEHYITTGRFVDSAPFLSDYTYLDIYYRSIREKSTDYLSAYDYLWRWDTDWFWCSKNLYMQNRVARRLMGRKRLNSITYAKVMRWNFKWNITRKLNRIAGYYPETVIQDIDIPVENAATFLAFLHREIGIKPIWICPIRAYNKTARYPLYPMHADTTYINFGFWDGVKSRQPHPPGYRNRKIEHLTTELGGIKSLYSDSYYTKEQFWQHYNESVYRALKAKYDTDNRLNDLYEKCVMKQ